MSSLSKTCHVYIMSNTSKMLYTGVTGDLETRILRHKTKPTDGFTKKYNLHRLIYFETFGDIRDAIAREKEIKGWLRAKKVALIESANPEWKDLAPDWMNKNRNSKRVSSRVHPMRMHEGSQHMRLLPIQLWPMLLQLRCFAQHDNTEAGDDYNRRTWRSSATLYRNGAQTATIATSPLS